MDSLSFHALASRFFVVSPYSSLSISFMLNGDRRRRAIIIKESHSAAAELHISLSPLVLASFSSEIIVSRRNFNENDI
jgi:hypothetical protein